MAEASERYAAVSHELAERSLDVEPMDDERRTLADVLALERLRFLLRPAGQGLGLVHSGF